MSAFKNRKASLPSSRKCNLRALTRRKNLIKRIRGSLEYFTKSLCVANFVLLVDKNERATKHDPITNPFPPNMMQVQSILITPIRYVDLSTSNARQINVYGFQDMQMENIGTFARDV